MQVAFLEEKLELLDQQVCNSDESAKLTLQLSFLEDKEELLHNQICRSSAQYRGLGIICDFATVSFSYSCADELAEEAALRVQNWWRHVRLHNPSVPAGVGFLQRFALGDQVGGEQPIVSVTDWVCLDVVKERFKIWVSDGHESSDFFIMSRNGRSNYLCEHLKKFGSFDDVKFIGMLEYSRECVDGKYFNFIFNGFPIGSFNIASGTFRPGSFGIDQWFRAP